MIFDPLIVTYALIGLSVILIGWIIRLEIKIHKLLRGKSGLSLENSIVGMGENLHKLNTFQRDAIAYFENIENRLRRSVQAVKTIRFNPFKGEGIGGNQSFSTSFVDEEGNGVVISSLYSRDRVSVFSKPLERFESPFELTGEERESIIKSKDSIK